MAFARAGGAVRRERPRALRSARPQRSLEGAPRPANGALLPRLAALLPPTPGDAQLLPKPETSSSNKKSAVTEADKRDFFLLQWHPLSGLPSGLVRLQRLSTLSPLLPLSHLPYRSPHTLPSDAPTHSAN